MTNRYTHSFYRSESERGAAYSKLKTPFQIEENGIQIVGVEFRNFMTLKDEYNNTGTLQLKFCFTQDDTTSVDANSYKLVIFFTERQHDTVEDESDINGGFILGEGELSDMYVNYHSSSGFEPISKQVLDAAGIIAVGVFEASR
ncbi:MAG: hypothetical protein JNK26_02455 [Candidatus Doudnabacteria bacterium]|nr:hypothetical protein [Candidatus Doudnabacteria bacterium]